LLLTIFAHFAVGITPSQSPSKFAAPLIGLPPLRDDCEPNSAAAIFPIGIPMLACFIDGISPTWRWQHEHHQWATS